MNPNTTIRPWILACGKQFGIRKAYEYRWDGADAKTDVKYATYRLSNCVPDTGVVLPLDSASGYNAVQKGSQAWITTVVIDLYNSQNGLYELASLCVALKNHQTIGELFEDNSTLVDARVVDQTEATGTKIHYHHQLTCEFRENVVHSLTDPNGVVETIRLQLDDGTYHDQYDIDDTGYTPT